MTKLLEWLTVSAVFSLIWAALVTDSLSFQVSDQIKDVLMPITILQSLTYISPYTTINNDNVTAANDRIRLPIYLLIVFACYSLASVGYGVMTFNDCIEAHNSLKMEVSEAIDDLKKKGLTM
ncbi:Dolichol-phosphate mannosyltransferase subunit 3 [Trichoplax sp. H2]|nr:Dolichol-phosphate mannosyltransferase subunit 3 [Trichoplax sp. H2]|eukprot:RDD46801.1 Dolichol-phosphate mannosyltransferase subunit 3 [Trichoplax sp. H2]